MSALIRSGRVLRAPAVSTAAVSAFSTTSIARQTTEVPSPAGARTTTGNLPLTWPTYLSLRRQRRLWSTLTSIPTTALGLFGGGGYFASLEADPTQLIMGVEPIYVYGGAT